VMPGLHPATANGPYEEARALAAASLSKAATVVNRVLQLGPNLAEAHLAAAWLQYVRGRLIAAEDSFLEALALDAGNPDALSGYALLLADVGRVEESLKFQRKLQLQEPFVPLFNLNLSQILWLNAQNDEAIAVLSAGPPYAPFYLARIYASAGRNNEAADTVVRTPSGIFLPGRLEAAARVLRGVPAQPAQTDNLGYLNWVYVYAGVPDRLVEESNAYLETAHYLPVSFVLQFWHPAYASARKTERFKTYVRNAGLVDYWRAKGWPQWCHPTTGDDFACS